VHLAHVGLDPLHLRLNRRDYPFSMHPRVRDQTRPVLVDFRQAATVEAIRMGVVQTECKLFLPEQAEDSQNGQRQDGLGVG